MNHEIFQWLECFGVGLAAAAVLTAVAVAFLYFILWAHKYEARLALWFAVHRHLLKALQVSGVVLIGVCAIFAIFELGCAVLEAL